MKVFSIAEIGINHGGDFQKAVGMIEAAAECGAKAVKFQKYNPLRVLGKEHPALAEANKAQFTWGALSRLRREAHKLGLLFGCSVFRVEDIADADDIVDFHKIATRMNNNSEFVAKIDATKKPVFMSVQPWTQVRKEYRDRFKLMWCIAGKYPSTMEEILGYPYQNIGLSSHCPYWEATWQAVKLGARVIENHVKENDIESGCDMSSSLNFADYKLLLQMIDKL